MRDFSLQLFSLETDESQFLDLNDDCIEHILWKLEPADLCSISFTCRRMQELAFDHFPRQYPDEQLEIRLGDGCETPVFEHFQATDKHLKYFAKCIRGVCVEAAGPHDRLEPLFDFVKSECCADLRSLQLYIYNMRPPPQLDVHDALLKHCKNIEHFEIHSSEVCCATWMMHEYRTMTSLYIDMSLQNSEKVAHAHRFVENAIRLNPQITKFECNGVDVTRLMWNYAGNIERMTFHLWNGDLPKLIDHLQGRKEHRLEWLGLKIKWCFRYGTDFRDVEMVNALQPIRYLNVALLSGDQDGALTSLPKLQSIVQLKLYVFVGCSRVNELFAVLSEHLPNLQDLRLYLVDRRFVNGTFKDVAMQFVQHSLAMKILNFILYDRDTFVFLPNDLVELNNLRWSIRGAEPMTIRLHYRGTYERPQFNYTAISVVNLKFGTFDDM